MAIRIARGIAIVSLITFGSLSCVQLCFRVHDPVGSRGPVHDWIKVGTEIRNLDYINDGNLYHKDEYAEEQRRLLDRALEIAQQKEFPRDMDAFSLYHDSARTEDSGSPVVLGSLFGSLIIGIGALSWIHGFTRGGRIPR